MARKTNVKDLIKKIEALENQSFAHKLLLDELEKKLQQAEETIQRLQDDPFGINKYGAIPAPYTPKYSPVVSSNHHCTAGMPDANGLAVCTVCGSPVYTVTITSNTTPTY
jgi:hypothetical protein